MKLSLKLQDEPPVIKAKIPISIFNQPFISSLTTTATSATPHDLSFSFSTNFSSGPSLGLTYTPVSTAAAATTTTTSTTTTTTSPFLLSLKSGLGLFGSPHDSPLIFSARFSLSPTNPSPLTPSFFLHFKPQFGNFSLRKTTSSSSSSNPSPVVPGPHLQSGSSSNSEFASGSVSNEASCWQDLKLEPRNADENGFMNFNPSFYSAVESRDGIGLVKERAMVWRDDKKGGFLSGISVKANTVLPVTKGVMVNLRWGVNFPADSKVKLPYLTLNKIGIERVEEVKEVKKEKKSVESSNAGDLELLKGMWFWMRRDLEVLEKENKDMKQCLEEMRRGVSAKSDRRGNYESGSSGEFDRWRGRKNGEGNAQTELKKPVSQANDLESQLQKAIKAASS